MDVNTLLSALFVGVVAGSFAGQLVQGTGFRLLGDIFVGIVGALVAATLFPTLGSRRRDHRRDNGCNRGGSHPPPDCATDKAGSA